MANNASSSTSNTAKPMILVMAVKKKGLGRGLDALFPEKSVKPAEKKPEQKSVATNESLHQQEEGSLNASAVKSAAETKDTAQAAVVEEPKKSEMLVKISKVEPNRTQPRKQFDEDALLELSESIKQFGILQPLLVSDKGDYYEIIAGERRWRAAKLAGLKEVPVIIKEFNDQQVVEISLIPSFASATHFRPNDGHRKSLRTTPFVNRSTDVQSHRFL